MRYASIRSMDISNGTGIGVTLFVQGCSHLPHCKNCFNSKTWDFNSGKEWNKEVENKFLEYISQPFITRLSLLGGEPMDFSETLIQLIQKVKSIKPNIKIWLWSGFTLAEIMDNKMQSELLSYIDYLIDGRYIDELRDLSLNFRGSKNQVIYEKINGEWIKSKLNN